MSRSAALILFGLFSLCNLFSQSESDSVLYHDGLSILDNSFNVEGYLKSAAYFDSISGTNPDHWLAHYYTGLSYILAARNSTTDRSRDELLDKAQNSINKSVKLKSDESENYIIQAFLYQVRLLIDPQGRALNFSQKADSILKKAIEADSSNPRAFFLLANNVYYTPPVFKGGPKNALPVFLKAKDKFRSFKTGLSFLPDWGEDQNEEMIRLCSNSKN